jgi:hypothetical protein
MVALVQRVTQMVIMLPQIRAAVAVVRHLIPQGIIQAVPAVPALLSLVILVLNNFLAAILRRLAAIPFTRLQLLDR